MPARVVFPELTQTQAELHALKVEKAQWMQAQVAGGKSRREVGAMLDPPITRQAVAQWLDWLARQEAAGR